MSKAAATRIDILNKAFDLIYKNGYQATSIDHIIATTQVTKGAFYYHFKTKEEMGLAMINEIMAPGMLDSMVKPLLESENPTKQIYQMMKNLLILDPFFSAQYGCPAINLIEEMAPVNPAFKSTLLKMIDTWHDAIKDSIRKAQLQGIVKTDIDPEQVALFISSTYAGIRNMGKIFGKASYEPFLREFKAYLKRLQ